MELHQLEYLTAVADEGSISKAARRLGIAQPSLSQALKKLEDSLGHKLLDRLPSGVVTTEAGRQLVEHAKRVLAEIADARRRIGDTPGAVSGSLAVGAIPTMAPFLLPPLLRQFTAKWPDVRLTVVEDVTERLLSMLERGELDVAVMSGAQVPPTVHSEAIATEPLRLMLPARHRLARRRAKAGAIAWRAVAGERLLVLQEMHCLAGQVTRFCDRTRRTPQVFMRGAQLSTIAAMVAAELGVSVVPEMMSNAGAWPGCAIRPFADESPTRDVCVAWSLLRYRTNAARAFEKLLRASV